MLMAKYVMLLVGAGLLTAALGMLLFDLALAMRFRAAKMRPRLEGEPELLEPEAVRWKTAAKLGGAACMALLMAASVVVVPSGKGGVKVSASRGTLAGTLYPGVHLVMPMVEHVQLFDLRDRLFTTGAGEDGVTKPNGDKLDVAKAEPLEVQSKEGLSIGMAVTVRYHLDAKRLDYVQSHLPQPVETEIVPPVVASAWREVAPNYTVREIFSSKREEVRAKAAETITRKLAADGIDVKEVMLRNIDLPAEYARGLNDLLLKEQQDDQLNVQTDMQAKQVKIAELEAEADKARKIKEAESEAQARVIEAKSESDAMQYTLPLKQKQIEQTKLEAEARKEATIQNAEAMAQAKVIDSKAEEQRRDLLAQAEANRIRVTAAADEVRMKGEAAVLNQSPLLINKIVAERLSDKIQVMMVPTDGKFFFANDVFKGLSGTQGAGAPGMGAGAAAQAMEDDPAMTARR
ncbi:MAG TPA: SPFH domain-containing protein [Acidobacteriaceae bacterium]|nr:SPFH domain-containing protein [Acidobacteriaceae bacterium]